MIASVASVGYYRYEIIKESGINKDLKGANNMINEKFKCTSEFFDEADLDHGLVGATYESENFKITLSYDGGYNKAKKLHVFDTNYVSFRLKPKDLSKYPTISYGFEGNPYDMAGLMPRDDCPITKRPISGANYKQIFAIYDEIFTFARTAFDEILPKYFPKDAEYI